MEMPELVSFEASEQQQFLSDLSSFRLIWDMQLWDAKTIRAHILSEQFEEQAKVIRVINLVVSRDPFSV